MVDSELLRVNKDLLIAYCQLDIRVIKLTINY
jgi:hypothetical protein